MKIVSWNMMKITENLLKRRFVALRQNDRDAGSQGDEGGDEFQA